MRRLGPIVVVILLVLVGAARAQEAAPPEPAPAAARAPVKSFYSGVNLLPMPLGKVATGPRGSATSSNLDFAYGLGLSFGYRVLAGLSVGVAPQVIFHLTSKDSAGYSVIDSEKEYDLMARIAYAYNVVPKIAVYAEALPGYSLLTYNRIILGSNTPKAHGIVFGGGVGATFAISERLFANASLGYQQGFQISHGISDRDVKTRFVRIALGGGVRF